MKKDIKKNNFPYKRFSEKHFDAIESKKIKNIFNRYNQDDLITFKDFYNNNSQASLEYNQINNKQEHHISLIIDKISEQKHFGKQLFLNKILHGWSSLIGENNNKICKPVFYDNKRKILFIGVSNSMNLYHLKQDKFLTQELLNKIKSQFQEIKKIQFQLTEPKF